MLELNQALVGVVERKRERDDWEGKLSVRLHHSVKEMTPEF